MISGIARKNKKPSAQNGTRFELFIVNLYRETGEISVHHDLNINGRQIDYVYDLPKIYGEAKYVHRKDRVVASPKVSEHIEKLERFLKIPCSRGEVATNREFDIISIDMADQCGLRLMDYFDLLGITYKLQPFWTRLPLLDLWKTARQQKENLTNARLQKYRLRKKASKQATLPRQLWHLMFRKSYQAQIKQYNALIRSYQENFQQAYSEMMDYARKKDVPGLDRLINSFNR